jgi:hypothetical protein
MPTPKTVDLSEILKSDPFYSPDTLLDLSSYPHLVPLADAPEETDEFAMPDRASKGLGSADLKKFLANPDRESVAELHDPEALKKYDEQYGNGSTVYASGVPFQVYLRDGKWNARGKVNGQLHRFTADTRDALYPKIMGVVNQNVIKELTRTQELEIIRLCQSGRGNEGIARYLEYRLGPERGASYNSPTELTSDPALLPVLNECASFTFFHSRPDVQNSPEFESFAQDYLAERPATHQLLSFAWEAFQRQQREQYRYELLAPEAENAPTATQIDDLDDVSVNRLMVDTKRQFAREVRAGVR